MAIPVRATRRNRLIKIAFLCVACVALCGITKTVSVPLTSRPSRVARDVEKRPSSAVEDVIGESRSVRHEMRRNRPMPKRPWPILYDLRNQLKTLLNLTSRTDCIAVDIKRSTSSVKWLARAARVLPSVEGALRNASVSTTLTRRDLRRLLDWPEGHCASKRESAEWCDVARQMIENGERILPSIRTARDFTLDFVRSSLPRRARRVLEQEREILHVLSDKSFQKKVEETLQRVDNLLRELKRCADIGATRWVGWSLMNQPTTLGGNHASTVPTMISADRSLRGDAVPFESKGESEALKKRFELREVGAMDVLSTVQRMTASQSFVKNQTTSHWLDVESDARSYAPCGEQRLRDETDKLWRNAASWLSRVMRLAAKAEELCRTAESRSSERTSEIRDDQDVMHQAATIETVARQFVARSRKLIAQYFVRPQNTTHNTTDIGSDCSGSNTGGSCTGCTTCASCTVDPWCGWCASTRSCHDGDETGIVLAALQDATSCSSRRWYHRHASDPHMRTCPEDDDTTHRNTSNEPSSTITDILHYIAPEDLSPQGGRRDAVHDSLTTWNRAMECERKRLEELDRRQRGGKMWTYSDSETTWFVHNYTSAEHGSAGDDMLTPPPYCNDALLARDIELSKAAMGVEAFDPEPSSSPRAPSDEEMEIQERAARHITSRAVKTNDATSTDRLRNTSKDTSKDNDGSSLNLNSNMSERSSFDISRGDVGVKQEKNKESKAPKFGPFSGGTFDDGMTNSADDADPNRIRVSLSRGPFEKYEQARMYCEKNYDHLCTEDDMKKAYKQGYRACVFGWFNSSNPYVKIGKDASGGEFGNDISACDNCNVAKSRKMVQRAMYMAKYNSRSVSNTKPNVDTDRCVAGTGLYVTERPQIEPAFCCGAEKVTPPEKYWANAKCDGKEHEECTLDTRCCWYQPAMWRERLGEGSYCLDKGACGLDDLNLNDPVIANRAKQQKSKTPEVCSREFPNDISGIRCSDMKHRRGPENATACEDACCRDMRCNAWQWCEAGKECSPEGSCWLGPGAENCTLETTVLRSSSDKISDKRLLKVYPPSIAGRRVKDESKLIALKDGRGKDAPQNGVFDGLRCEGLNFTHVTEREVVAGFPVLIQYVSDCEGACRDQIGCGAWQWCDRKLTAENMDNHCEPLGSCHIGPGIRSRGPIRLSNCTRKEGLIGKTYGTHGIVGRAIDAPKMRSKQIVKEQKSKPINTTLSLSSETTTTESVRWTGEEEPTVDERIRRTMASSMKELLKSFDPFGDFDALDLLAKGDDRRGKQESEEEKRAVRDMFCDKLARAQTAAHVSRITSSETMQSLRRSCSSVRCVALVDECIAYYKGRELENGHDVPGEQWRWHHKAS